MSAQLGQARVWAQEGGAVALPASLQYFGADFDTPAGPDWAVPVAAAAAADPVYPSIAVRQFSDLVEQGAGWALSIPGDATSMEIVCVSRADTPPPGLRSILAKIYMRQIIDTAPVGAWSSVALLDDPGPFANGEFRYDLLGPAGGQSLAAWGLSVGLGNVWQFEITRPPGGTLVGLWNLAALVVTFR